MRLEVGLIGATGIAERAVVAPSRDNPDVGVVAVAASDPDRARVFAEKHGVPHVHQDYAALVEDPAVNTVYVSLHNSAHHRWAVAAASAGKHVLVEKPLCLNADEVASLAEAASGVHVVEALPTAGHPWQEAVRAGSRWGRLRAMRTRIRFGLPAGGYRLRPELGGGIFLDAACYWLQAVQATVGLGGARGNGRKSSIGGVDVAFTASLDLPGEVSAVLECSWDATHVAEHEYWFEHASVRVRNFLRPTAGALPLNLAVRWADGRTEIESFPAMAYYTEQLRRFHALVSGGARPDLGDAAERIALMAEIHENAEEAR
ncbi:Gfo/Idh/MocA family oxidoreductase [Lentzea tibetensis]|uniref:Gfo/Idh/MocA family oxidoreductase n=1 Tax=Lentzea tibetensis TaxID=2591470 RepID=A0A563EJG4_9PSEU|nr:Gfo/Idh/MocA family oxidoreductase [Lentzea tibetensis]TWP47009.1 Gfo/Idh/MocA family oxidoreductase [Lentzea tibetensis]